MGGQNTTEKEWCRNSPSKQKAKQQSIVIVGEAAQGCEEEIFQSAKVWEEGRSSEAICPKTKKRDDTVIVCSGL